MSLIYNTVQSFFSMRMNKRALSYAASRCIDEVTLIKHGVGFWPLTYKNYKPGKVLYSFVSKMCHPIGSKELLDSKLFQEIGGTLRDVQPESLTFPIYQNDNIVSFSMRSIDPISTIKHFHMPGNKYLWNEQALKANTTCIVEGLFDGLTLSQCGYDVVSTLGIFISDEVLNKIVSTAKNIIICYDNDANQSGQNASKKLARKLIENKFYNVRIAYINSYARKVDYNQLLVEHKQEDIHRTIEKAKLAFTEEEVKKILEEKYIKDQYNRERKEQKTEQSERIKKVRDVNIRNILSNINARSFGEHYYCIIPGHNDSTASFKIKDNRFHCFGCGRSGDGIGLIMAVKDCRFWDAVEMIEEMDINVD